MLEAAQDVIIGIDLGTTNSEVAVVQNGKVVVIAENDSNMLPSVVAIDDEGGVLVGQAAKNQLVVYPERTVKSIKRLMGTDQSVVLGERSYTPQEISAIILKRLKRRAEDYLGHSVSRCVVTVPAYFSDLQRQATREAAEIAGLTVERMINEPTAAALAYEAGDNCHKKILVFDLGGGTFDVSIVAMENEVVEVLSSHGNNHLGGDDFDEKIVQHIHRHLAGQGISLESDKKAQARVRRAAETAKIQLSNNPFVRVEEEFLTTRKGSPYNLSLEIARHDYEEMIDTFIDESMSAVQVALEGANMTARDIDEVLLVGGSTRTPVIKRRLEALFSVDPRLEIDPDLCVATGAAIQAATIAGERVSTVLVDITPYTFGTSAFGEYKGLPYPYVYAPVIDKNTPLPVTKSEVFCTMHDEQSTIDVNIYQGEDSDALNNIPLGSFRVEGLSAVPAGNPIVLSLSLDLNGILKVKATEKNTGLNKSIVIDNAMGQLDEASLADARARIDQLFDDAQVDGGGDGDVGEPAQEVTADNKTRVQAQALIEKAERLLGSVGEEDREDLVNNIEVVSDSLKSNDLPQLDLATEELADLIYYLET